MTNHPNELDLLAWIEGDLSADRAEIVRRALDADPALASRLHAMRADRAALRAIADPALTPAPRGLVSAAIESAERSAVLDDDLAPAVAGRISPVRRVAMAAGFFLVLTAGAAVLFSGALSSQGDQPTRQLADAGDASLPADQGEPALAMAMAESAAPSATRETVEVPEEFFQASGEARQSIAMLDDASDTRPTLSDLTRSLRISADRGVGMSSLQSVSRPVGLTSLPLVMQPGGHADGRAVRYAGSDRIIASWDPPAIAETTRAPSPAEVSLTDAIRLAESGRLVIRVQTHRPAVVNATLGAMVGLPGHNPICLEESADTCRRTEVVVDADPSCLQSLVFSLCRDGGPGAFAQFLVMPEDARSPDGRSLAARMRGSLVVVPVLIEPAG